MLKIISLTTVFEEYKFRSGEEAKRLFELANSNFGEEAPKPPEKTKTGRLKVERGSQLVHILLLAYLKRIPLQKEYQPILEYVLKFLPTIFESWLGISIEISNLYKQRRI